MWLKLSWLLSIGISYLFLKNKRMNNSPTSLNILLENQRIFFSYKEKLLMFLVLFGKFIILLSFKLSGNFCDYYK